MAMQVNNMGTEVLIEKMMELNPNRVMRMLDEPILTICVVGNPEKLNFPEGYYYNKKNGITNKHNTTSGMYESIEVFPALA